MALLGAEVPEGHSLPSAAFPARAADLPEMPDLAEQVIAACSKGAFFDLLKATCSDSGEPQPSRMLGAMPRFEMVGLGGLSWKNADTKRSIDDWTGVIVRVKPYRNYWQKVAASPGMTPKEIEDLPNYLSCASMDLRVGTGDPGGDCHGCPKAIYDPVDRQYCKQRSQMYVVGLTGNQIARFDLPAMARQGLMPLVRWADGQGVALHMLAVQAHLVEHEKKIGNNKQAKLSLSPVGWVRPAAGAAERYDNAIRDAQEVLRMVENAWLEGIGDFGGAGQVYDSEGAGPTAPACPCPSGLPPGSRPDGSSTRSPACP